MLNWSNTAYKFTLGVGALAMTGLIGDVWDENLPIWCVMLICVLPIAAFIFARPGELPERWVLTAHVLGSLWYLGWAIFLLARLLAAPHPPAGAHVVYPLFVGLGMIPCGIVLWRWLRGERRGVE
jgi:hypothetical protein